MYNLYFCNLSHLVDSTLGNEKEAACAQSRLFLLFIGPRASSLLKSLVDEPLHEILHLLCPFQGQAEETIHILLPQMSFLTNFTIMFFPSP